MSQPVPNSETEQLRATLRAHSISPTRQRMAIASRLLSRPQHVSADQLLAWIHADGMRVSKATVYNTLNLFTRKGLLREVVVDPTRVFYDSTTAPHYHFYNVDTGELEDIPAEDIGFSRFPDLPEGTDHDSVNVVIRVHNR